MNVRLRFLGVVSLVALVSSAAPLAAQSAVPPNNSNTNVGLVAAPLAGLAVPHVPITTPAVQTTEPTARDSATAIARGPSMSSARVAAHQVSTTRGAPPVLQNRTSNRNAVALMIVGGAALVIGAVIGDDAGTLVMLGGAAVGLYGLYMFLT
ncbi:MAG TPA: hypothetical protein VFZ21_11700 [Gemmatimonadaceae bacterium]|nr:hypothetical protein [Gemmatimonadaceae bacterium]